MKAERWPCSSALQIGNRTWNWKVSPTVWYQTLKPRSRASNPSPHITKQQRHSTLNFTSTSPVTRSEDKFSLKKKKVCTTANWWFWCMNNSVTFRFTLRHNRAEGTEAGKTTCVTLVAFLGLASFRRAEEMKFCKRQHESSHWPPTCESCQLLIQALASWVSPVLSSRLRPG